MTFNVSPKYPDPNYPSAEAGDEPYLDPDYMDDATLAGSERIALKQYGSWFRTTVSAIAAFVTGIYTITVHAGVGAVARTLLAILRDQPVSVKSFGAALPVSGRYHAGDVINNTAPAILGTAGSRYTVQGWKRLTSGVAHVLNTDWVELRCLTGT